MRLTQGPVRTFTLLPLLASVLVVSPLLVGSAAACSMAGRVLTIKGTLVQAQDEVATFRVEELVDVVAPDQLGSSRIAIPKPGDTVDVGYTADDLGWLETGQSYLVSLTPGAESWVSGVYTPGEGSCAINGTTWTDGSPINTAVWTWRGLRTVPGLGLVILIVLLAAVAAWGGRRRQRRRPLSALASEYPSPDVRP
jgi:hypothetical protein